MFKKIVVGTLLAGLIGILVLGAINRTMDKTGKVAEAQGQGFGRDRTEGESNGRGGYGQGGAGNGANERQYPNYQTAPGAQGQGGGELNGRGGYGQGGAGNSANERQYPNYQTAPEEWVIYEGTVVQTPEGGEELVIAIGNGKEVTVGTGPSYMAAQSFTLQAGEMVQVQGYWEGNEFKAAQVTRLADGQTITLRDEVGRPAWAGGGRNAQAGQGGQDAPGDPTGTGQAEVDEWLQLRGTVVSVDADALVVETAAGEEVVVENRPWWFAQEQSFSAQVGDQMTLTGFYEGSDFEVGWIENTTNGQAVLIRDENGRPLWAGRGQRGM